MFQTPSGPADPFGRIIGLIPNSTASDAGLRSDDYLLRVGNASTLDQYHKRLSQNPGVPLRVVVVRAVRTKTRTMNFQWSPWRFGILETGFTLLPVSVASGTYLPSDALRPFYPRSTRHLISNTQSRPRAPPVAAKWAGHAFPTYDGANLPYTIRSIYETQKLENKTGVCFRNVATQLLLNCGPAFTIFLQEHYGLGSCKIRDCIAHSLFRLHLAYTGALTGNQQQNTYLAQTAFYDLCDKVFWGQRAAIKHKISYSLESGGFSESFLLYVLAEIRQQLRTIPEDMQAFERIWQIEIRISDECVEGHIAGYESHNIFSLALNRTNVDLNITSISDCISRYISHIDRIREVPDTEPYQGRFPPRKSKDAECSICERNLTITRREILNCPEMLILRCPARLGGDWKKFSYTVALQEQIIVKEMQVHGSSAEYTLVGVGLYTGWSHDPTSIGLPAGTGHTVAAVRAPNAKIALINNSTVTEYGSWAEIEAFQKPPTSYKDSLYPSLLIYRLSNRHIFSDPERPMFSSRASPASNSMVNQIRVGLRIRNFCGEDDSTRKKLRDHERITRDLVENFPGIPLVRILDTYKACSGSIQSTVDTLVKNEVSELVTLDTITRGQRHEIMKWYVRFPHLSVANIYDAVKLKSDNAIHRALGNTSRINVRSHQNIGLATMHTELDLWRDQYIRGKCVYTAVGGARYTGNFGGRLKLEAGPVASSSIS